jgi:hypothetical protein
MDTAEKLNDNVYWRNDDGDAHLEYHGSVASFVRHWRSTGQEQLPILFTG